MDFPIIIIIIIILTFATDKNLVPDLLTWFGDPGTDACIVKSRNLLAGDDCACDL